MAWSWASVTWLVADTVFPVCGRMQKIWTDAVNDRGILHVADCVKTAEWIDVLKTTGDRRYIVLSGSPNFPHGFHVAFVKFLWPHAHF